jgi:hypothetical protein
MPSEFHYLRIRVQLQQHRFLNFGLQAGILAREGKLCHSLQVNLSLLLAVLAEIKMLLEQYFTLDEKYGNSSISTVIDLNDYYHEAEVGLMDMLRLPTLDDTNCAGDMKRGQLSPVRKIGQKILRTGRNLRKIVAEPRRITWANLDKEAFQSLTTKLETLNSFLTSLLDTSQIRRLEDTMNAAYQEILQLRNGVENLTCLVEALTLDKGVREIGYLTSIRPGGGFLSGVAQQEMEALQAKKYHLWLTQVKIQYTALDKLTSRPIIPADDIESIRATYGLKRVTRLELTQLAFDEARPNRDLELQRLNATYEGRNVWVEWKHVRASSNSNAAINNQQIEGRIILLTDLLSFKKPEGFRAPDCLGYVKDSSSDRMLSRFGIVFEKPTTSSKLTTLHQLLEKAAKPSLSSRMCLCATLARSIYSFHAVNWMHKGLRSQNIIFFLNDSARPDLGAPFLSGFELSRPSMRAEMTENPDFNPFQDIYRHPLAQSSEASSRYRRSYDIYSLGIMLIEIALWKCIEDVVGFGDLGEVRPQHLQGMKDLLLGNPTKSIAGTPTVPENRPCVERIAAECGDVFQDAVKVCFTADHVENEQFRGELDEEIAVRLLRMVRKEIVNKLERIAVSLQRD